MIIIIIVNIVTFNGLKLGKKINFDSLLLNVVINYLCDIKTLEQEVETLHVHLDLSYNLGQKLG